MYAFYTTRSARNQLTPAIEMDISFEPGKAHAVIPPVHLDSLHNSLTAYQRVVIKTRHLLCERRSVSSVFIRFVTHVIGTPTSHLLCQVESDILGKQARHQSPISRFLSFENRNVVVCQGGKWRFLTELNSVSHEQWVQ